MGTSTLVAETAQFTVRTISVSEMHNNVYLITSRGTGRQVLIDAADDVEAIGRLRRESAEDTQQSVQLEWILTTHQHWDHVRALRAVAEDSGARIAAGADDADAIAEAESVTMDRHLIHGERISSGDLTLDCVHLRGHTPGSIAYVLTEGLERPLIFSGDALFPGGVGNTWGDPERFAQLLGDVTERLFGVYDDATVLPGHGAGTTLEAERGQLPAWKARGW
ncbi:MBL fold metallo-hydrolase [Zhihengliuella flava]|uniref:Glyoxylase-like metal-dependent hydrolase (Beta-lactamase superfamily II) n=1 Tax=Zhihengliuella flava TaxID=1285193 RepID=A0A931GDX1_9MICC|nr:MBL fold metallo-hydrolase [Zhihengliuella flava]MBG6083420.1 glyoxylase-like metal-dependent hydrolase (beta-lactamase superfamily II) [Zhihengliuella flava]